MKQYLLNKIFEKNKHFFFNKVADDLIGTIPASTLEPAFTILDQYKDTLTKWLIWWSWNVQKRYMFDKENAQLVKGILLACKLLLAKFSAQKQKVGLPDVTIEKETDPMEGVEKFLKREGLTDKK